jgi:glycerol-3-phosphate acyltransferase PlsY
MEYFLSIALSYLCGSIPFGLILTNLFSNKDIRKIGSGNIGATNVLRTGNKFLAASTLILDILKGYFPIILAKQYFPEMIELSCISAFLGHLFPCWLKFKGGKGVATYLGIITALSFQLSFLFIFTWIVILLIFKYSSVSSMFGSLTVFIVNFIRDMFDSINQSSALNIHITDSKILFIFFILIIFTHRKNILNLKNKVEDKIKI